MTWIVRQNETVLKPKLDKSPAAPLEQKQQCAESEKHNNMGSDGVEETIFLIDWDDTLCASTVAQKSMTPAMMPSLIGPRTQQEHCEWSTLGMWVHTLLSTVSFYGPIYVVTNSQEGWVELSIERFMPILKPFLPRIHVISARSKFATPDQEKAVASGGTGSALESILIEWKYLAFSHVILRHRLAVQNGERFLWKLPKIVAMGDSTVELDAMNRVAKMFNVPITKWIKFCIKPSIASLVKQIKYLCSILPSIVWYPNSLRITLNPNLFTNTDQNSKNPTPDPFKK